MIWPHLDDCDVTAMLDIRVIRENPDLVKQVVSQKHDLVDVGQILALDGERREALHRVEALKAERNAKSKAVGAAIKSGGDAEAIKAEVRAIGEETAALEERLRTIESSLQDLLLRVPNLTHKSVPEGGEENNRIERTVGTQREFSFTPKPHWELGEALDMLDLPRGTKIAGPSFVVLKGAGARLQRALINFMLDLHTTEHGYTEVRPPYLVNRETLTGTGQLPKLEEDMYRTTDDMFLIPTAEVPVTNLHRDEVIPPATLPLYYVSYTPCFRREAGSYGKETRGLSRVHQFDKVELVKIVEPQTSWDEHEKLLADAESVLQAFGLCYRVVTLAAGDLSFAAAKCYDLEVWAPGMQTWLEVSSCSNFVDFQSRRMNMRYKPDAQAKPEFPHTLNASGLALPRLVIAIMENYQNEDGSITIPEKLKGYFGAEKI